MAEEQLSPSIAAAVFDTEVGNVTDVVTQADGLVILKVEELFPAETTEFDSVKKDIARTITAEKGVGEVAQAYADKLLADWAANGTPSDDVLAEQAVFSMETPTFLLGAPNFPGLTDAPTSSKPSPTRKRLGCSPRHLQCLVAESSRKLRNSMNRRMKTLKVTKKVFGWVLKRLPATNGCKRGRMTWWHGRT